MSVRTPRPPAKPRAGSKAPAESRAVRDYLAGFAEDPGYLDFATFGPLSRAVAGESDATQSLLSHARWGAAERIEQGVGRMRAAAARVTGFREDQVVFQPSTTYGIAQALYGLRGAVLVSPADYPSVTATSLRAAQAFRGPDPVPLPTEHGRVTPGAVREALTDEVAAVAVTLVDARTGYLTDLDGVRQVIGDRLLVVDAAQGLGAVDVPWQAADVLAATGYKWLRAGYGCAFLALSDRAAERLTPVLSGAAGYPEDAPFWDEVPDPADGAAGFQMATPDPVAAARLAVGLEELADTGAAAVAERVADRVDRVLELADEAHLPVVSPRDRAERAGIVVLDPPEERRTPLTAALHNHGVSVTLRQGRVRISPHAGTTSETLGMLRAALRATPTAAHSLHR